MRTKNWLAVLGLLMVLVLAAAACGGGDDSGSDDEGDSSSEESSDAGAGDWVDEVSALCEDWVGEVEDVDGTDADEIAELGETTAAFHDDVEELDAPDDVADDADDFVSAVDDVAEYSADAAESLEANGGQGVDVDVAERGNEATVALLEAAEALDLDCDLSVIDSRQDDFSEELSDFSDDASSDFSDFSDDLSDAGGFESESLDPTIFIPEFGDDPALDELALDCEAGDFAACDQLYFDSPISESTGSYEGYGATCGGRLAEEDSGNCQNIAAGN